jgi:hypothetical protein
MTAASDAGRAAELICFALQPKLARGADDRYGDLWGEYRTDEDFRDVVDAVAAGLGLVVIDASEQGLVVAPMERSPFTFRLADYSSGLTPKRRLLTGLAHLGIAALAYPREADLEDDIVVRRSVEQVERFLRDACQALADAEEKDPVSNDDDDEALAWREYLAMPSTRRISKGGYSIECTMGIISRAFDWLATQGMARPSGTSYQLLDRYRVQIRELAGHAALERLRELAAAGVDEVGTGLGLDAGDDDDELEEAPGHRTEDEREMASEGQG